MASLDFTARYGRKRNDEIGSLGLSVDAIAEELSGTIAELSGANEGIRREMGRQQDLLAAVSHEFKPLAVSAAPLDLTSVAARAVSRFSLETRGKGVEIRLEKAGAGLALIDEDRVAAEADAVRLEVANDGAPIPDEHLPRLFEPFFRSDPSRSRRSGGSGLGLAVVKAITSAHGGTCGVRNTDGGVLFWVAFPR